MSLDLVTLQALRALLDESKDLGNHAGSSLIDALKAHDDGLDSLALSHACGAFNALNARADALETALRKLIEAITPTRII